MKPAAYINVGLLFLHKHFTDYLTSLNPFPKTGRSFFRSMYFFLPGNAYILQDANDMRRNSQEIQTVALHLEGLTCV